MTHLLKGRMGPAYEVPTSDETLGSIKDGCAMARYILSLEAEAQLATRLPTRAEIEAKFGEWAMTGESTVMKARWMHEWLLSGAATPAPTAALTRDWRLWKDMKSRKCIGVFDVNLPDLERRVAPCLWPLCDCERAKSPPQGAEE